MFLLLQSTDRILVVRHGVSQIVKYWTMSAYRRPSFSSNTVAYGDAEY